MWQKSNAQERRGNRPKVGFYQHLGRRARSIVAGIQQAPEPRPLECQIVE
jgi:hypothetical protein